VQKRTIIVFILLFYTGLASAQTVCEASFQYTPSTANGQINWKQFPKFSLPFKVVYSGPRFNDSEQLPLQYGFSHLANFTGSDINLQQKNRAVLWYGVASLAGQPWYEIESPWANDLVKYQQKWTDDMKNMSNLFQDTQGKSMPNVDILMLDIEREIPTDAGIRSLKTNQSVPAQYRTLSDVDFTERYKRDLSNLYSVPITHLGKNNIPSTTTFASYSDAPIKNTEFPLNYTWQEWQTSDKVLNYYMKDTLTNSVGGKFYNQNTFLAPSAYFCYEYSSLAYPNLAYQLFQVEANVARSNKDVMLFQWLTYNKCQPSSTYSFNTNIKKYLAEAQAIFPFFSGAKGLWLWESPSISNTANYSIYEAYIYGLFRLSEFKDFFSGNYRLVIPKTAYDHFKSQDAIWRGAVKGNEILIAAINEFADEGATTELTVSFGEWSQKITLRGKETFLCKFPLPDLQSAYIIYPNPNNGKYTFEYLGGGVLNGNFKVFDIFGKEVYAETTAGTSPKKEFDLSLPSGIYFLKYTSESKIITKKIIVN
jgi:Secretion system C-terminal sorting domain